MGIFLLAARLVANARKGNRRVRAARDDPHRDNATYHGKDPGRDIEQ
jgi:hypothetical protein